MFLQRKKQSRLVHFKNLFSVEHLQTCAEIQATRLKRRDDASYQVELVKQSRSRDAKHMILAGGAQRRVLPLQF